MGRTMGPVFWKEVMTNFELEVKLDVSFSWTEAYSVYLVDLFFQTLVRKVFNSLWKEKAAYS